MQDAIVLGGGISGLTTGYLLQQKGLDFSVIEKNSFPGGPIQSVIKDGFLVEKGPNSLLVSDPWIESFISDLGIGNEIVDSNPSAANRYVVRNSRPIPVPRSPLQAITTSLFSLKAKFGFLGEPFQGRIPWNCSTRRLEGKILSLERAVPRKDFLEEKLELGCL